MPSLQLTVLGSGTSMGVPTLGCRCAVCESADPRDNRTRPSVQMAYGGRNVVIDTTPDFRLQALRARMDHLDAVLYTHAHADHILGLDDIRPFNLKQNRAVPLYGAPETLAILRRQFGYIFDPGPVESTLPSVERSKATSADSRVASIPGYSRIATIAAYCTGVRSKSAHSSMKIATAICCMRRIKCPGLV